MTYKQSSYSFADNKSDLLKVLKAIKYGICKPTGLSLFGSEIFTSTTIPKGEIWFTKSDDPEVIFKLVNIGEEKSNVN